MYEKNRRENHAVTTTTLVHRISRVAGPWWHDSVVYNFDGLLGATELKAAQKALAGLARAGFDAVNVRPANLDIIADPTPLQDFIGAAHRVGLRALVRLGGAVLVADEADVEHPNLADINPCRGFEVDTATSVVRARLALLAGADGLDLGRVIEPIHDPLGTYTDETFTRLVLLLQAELLALGEDRILVATVGTSKREVVLHHLHEDWAHHWLGEELTKNFMNALKVRQVVTLALNDRDRLGFVGAWSAIRTDAPLSIGTRCGPRVAGGRGLFALAIPGCAYLHEGGCAGLPAEKEFPISVSHDQPGATAVVRAALQVRKERRMGVSSFAWVDGLSWTNKDTVVGLCGGVLVVWNLSEETLQAPSGTQILVSSTFDTATFNTTKFELPPGDCAWILSPAPTF